MEIEVCEPCQPKPVKKKYNVCNHENCNISAFFNFEGEKKGIYCTSHKLGNMQNVIDRKCQEPNCGKIPFFNFEGETKGIFCQAHAQENMHNVKDRKCQEPNCGKIPFFNFEGKKTGIFCQEHAKENMRNVKDRQCKELNCKLLASYNFEGKKGGIFCQEHAKENMQNVRDHRCQDPNCNIIASFNFENKKTGLFCKSHAHSGMINVRSRLCKEDGCYVHAHYNYKGNKSGLYCKKHKKISMTDVVNTTCIYDWCDTVAGKKYEGYCFVCYVQTFPDKPIVRNYKTKERAVNDYIKEQFPDVTWISDKRTLDACSKKRPDLLLDLGYQILIIEIDENQHERYEEICENKRIMELSQDLQFRPIIFIRFNPDEYKNGESKITSCWNYTKKGLMSVKKSKEKEWSNRLETLKETVEYWMNNQIEKTIELVYLFYDKTI
jgi:hypothetical protein